MYTQKKTIENVHIVRERDRERFREMLAVLLLAAPVGLFLLLFTWQNIQVIQLGREATELRRQREELELHNRDLRFRIQKMTSLDTVEEKAREVGLTSTDSTAVVTLRHAGASKEQRR